MFDLTAKSCAQPPAPCRVKRALLQVGDQLASGRDDEELRLRVVLDREHRECFFYHGAFHFPLGEGWSISLAPESAQRFRLSACHWSRPRATLWSLDGEDEHLAGVVLELTRMVGCRDSDETIMEGKSLR